MTTFAKPETIYRNFRSEVNNGIIGVQTRKILRNHPDVLGHIDPTGYNGDTLILIKAGLPAYLAGETLFHELTHHYHPKATEEEVTAYAPIGYRELGPRRRSVLEYYAQNGTNLRRYA